MSVITTRTNANIKLDIVIAPYQVDTNQDLKPGCQVCRAGTYDTSDTTQHHTSKPPTTMETANVAQPAPQKIIKLGEAGMAYTFDHDDPQDCVECVDGK